MREFIEAWLLPICLLVAGALVIGGYCAIMYAAVGHL